MLLIVLFWGAAALVIYTYAVFPLVVHCRGRWWPTPYQGADIEPPVSMIIAAHNEAQGIGAKLDNILSLDYPADRLEVLVASDGSDDGTEAIVRRYAARGVKLLALSRRGKAAALNAAVAASAGEILVFSDANSMYTPDAIRALVRPLADPKVGGVAGNQQYRTGQKAPATGAGEQAYWDFDRRLKQSQSRSGNAISATGAIYAVRRSLFLNVPDGVTDDFVTSTRVIAQGYRLVFAPAAVAYEPVADSGGLEFGRKVRVMTRGLRGVLVMRQLLNPFRYGFYAIQLFAHKVLRRLMVFPLLVLLPSSLLLWGSGLVYQALALAQLGFYSLAALQIPLAATRLGRTRAFTFPFFFCLVNAASLVAVFNLVRGHRIDRWEPSRRDAPPPTDRLLLSTQDSTSP